MNPDLTLVGAPLLLMGILNGIGAWLKSIPKFPNTWIPVLLPVMGAIIYAVAFKMPDIGDEFLAGPDIGWLVKAIYGFGVGMAAVGGHQAISQLKTENNGQVSNIKTGNTV